MRTAVSATLVLATATVATVYFVTRASDEPGTAASEQAQAEAPNGAHSANSGTGSPGIGVRANPDGLERRPRVERQPWKC